MEKHTHKGKEIHLKEEDALHIDGVKIPMRYDQDAQKHYSPVGYFPRHSSHEEWARSFIDHSENLSHDVLTNLKFDNNGNSTKCGFFCKIWRAITGIFSKG